MSRTPFKYRPEIDGLRAIAVVSVIFFHGKLPGFSGGFIGVDVFFVISGYLITSILLRELESESFSIARFYERRMRRILPALFTVLLACIPFAWLLMGPYAFRDFGQGLIAVPVFISNILFWRTTNYFNATQENVLLHTWSLGVEEQFYIFFPLFLWLVWRYARRWLGASIVLTIIVSLGISQWGIETGRALAAFYLSPTRAYELLTGSLVALMLWRGPVIDAKRLASSLAWTGLLLVLASIVLYDQTTPFPGLYALTPTIGTALIIACARRESAVGRLLSLKGMVGVGLISYSAYLWHQPVFVFAHMMDRQPGIGGDIFLAILSLGLGALSWRFVEQPFRSRSFLSQKAIYGLSLSASCIVMTLGGWIYITNGVSQRFTPEELSWWRYTDITTQSKYVTKRFSELSGQIQPTAEQKILVVGDSYAQDFINMVYEARRLKNAQIRTVYIPAVCQIVYISEKITSFIAPIDRAVCSNQPTLQSVQHMIEQADTIILAANWRKWSASRLPETISNMALRPDQKLLIVGSKSFRPVDVRNLMHMSKTQRSAQHRTIPDPISEINTLMKDTLPPDMFVDQIHIICGTSEQCPLMTPDDRLISYDGAHLTQEGAKYIGERLFSSRPLLGFR